MLPNTTYDLAEQLSQESKSLWRIENEYIQNAEGNGELTTFWKEMKKDKEQHITRITELLKKEL
ncbi:MAG: hypothetical protein WD579_02145 [Candidatus Paceibacterota bacterium]